MPSRPLCDLIGIAQAPLGVTRVRVKFSKPGVYHYICALHDGPGVKGTVVAQKQLPSLQFEGGPWTTPPSWIITS